MAVPLKPERLHQGERRDDKNGRQHHVQSKNPHVQPKQVGIGHDLAEIILRGP